jgi:hypothetical protein
MTYGVWVGAGVGERVMVAVSVGGGRVGVSEGSGVGAQADKRNEASRSARASFPIVLLMPATPEDGSSG